MNLLPFQRDHLVCGCFQSEPQRLHYWCATLYLPHKTTYLCLLFCVCVCVCAGLGADFVFEKSISFLEIGLPSQAVTLLFYFFMAKFSAKACVQQCSHGVFISAKILGYTFIFYFHSNTLSIFPIILCVSVWENFGAPAMMDTKICIQLFFFFFWLCSSSWEAAVVVQSFSQVPSQQQGSGFEPFMLVFSSLYVSEWCVFCHGHLRHVQGVFLPLGSIAWFIFLQYWQKQRDLGRCCAF